MLVLERGITFGASRLFIRVHLMLGTDCQAKRLIHLAPCQFPSEGQRFVCRLLCIVLQAPWCYCSVLCYSLSQFYGSFPSAKKVCKSAAQFCYVCGEVTFKSQRKTFTPLVKNVMSFILGAKQVTWISPGLLIFAIQRVLGF